MGTAAMLLGGIKDSDFASVLALLRPVYAGGTWGIGDASGYERVVTNVGLTIGAEGSGPWGGSSRAILDLSNTTQAACLMPGIVRGFGTWVYAPYRASLLSAFMTIFSPATQSMFACLATRIGDNSSYTKFSYTSGSGGQEIVSGNYPINTWNFVSVGFGPDSPGDVVLRINGLAVATSEGYASFPIGADQSLRIGGYAYGTAYSFYGGRVAESIVVSDGRFYDANFAVPSEPFYS